MKYSLVFILRTDKKNKRMECPISLRYTNNRRSFKIPLGISIKEEYWDEKVKLPITSTPHFKMIYNQMTQLETLITEQITNFFNENGRFPEYNEINKLSTKKKDDQLPKTQILVRDIFQEFIDFSVDGRVVKQSTIVVYKTTLKKWISYEDSIGRKLRLLDISFKTLDNFSIFLKSQNMIYSSVGKYIKTIKTLLNSYVIKREKINIDLDFKSIKIEKSIENNFEYLTEKEFEILKNAVFYSQFNLDGEDIELTPSEKNIGRMFLFMCSTGLCYVDLMNLKLHNIVVEDKKLDLKNSTKKESKFIYISITRQKTKHEAHCLIPILGLTIELLISILGAPIEYVGAHVTEIPNSARIRIFKKFLSERLVYDKTKTADDYRVFKPISNQVFNRSLKILFDKLKFHETFSIRKDRNENEIEIKRKCDIITSHTGRRTYITLCLSKGIRPDSLMQTTGHKKYETMKKYTKFDAGLISEEFENKLGKN